jgi:tetratricopeptide (TPR) repeat protein
MEKLLKEKKFREVVDLGLKYMGSHSSSFIIVYYIAQSYEGLFQFRHAIESYEKSLVLLAQENKGALRLEIYNKLGDLYAKIHDNESAIGYFNLVLQENSRNLKALYLSAKLLFELKRYQKAQERLETYVNFKPKEVAPLMLLARIYYETKEHQKSSALLDRLLLSGEDALIAANEDAILLLAKNHFALKNYDKAVPYLKNLLNKRQMIDETIPLLILSLIHDKKINEAQLICRDNIVLIPMDKRSEALYQTARALFEEHEIYEAARTWKQVFEINSKYLDVKDIMARFQIFLDNPILENYFTTDEALFIDFISKRFSLIAENFVFKEKDFWIVKTSRDLFVLYRKADLISSHTLDEIDARVKDYFQVGTNISVYSLFGMEQNCKEYSFYKRIEDISLEAFVNFFSKPDSSEE